MMGNLYNPAQLNTDSSIFYIKKQTLIVVGLLHVDVRIIIYMQIQQQFNNTSHTDTTDSLWSKGSLKTFANIFIPVCWVFSFSLI